MRMYSGKKHIQKNMVMKQYTWQSKFSWVTRVDQPIGDLDVTQTSPTGSTQPQSAVSLVKSVSYVTCDTVARW